MDTIGSITLAVATPHGSAIPATAAVIVAIIATIVLVVARRLVLRYVINNQRRRVAAFLGSAVLCGVLLALTMH